MKRKMNNRLRMLLTAGLAALLILTLAGCQADQGAPKQQAAQKPSVINVSYSLRPLNVPSIVALEKKMFEEEFAKDGIEIKWYELEGPATTEALAAKSLDIATSLNYVTAIITKANGNDIKVVANYSKFPKAIGLLAAAGKGIDSVSDLKGKKVALQKGTMLHELLIRALEEAKLLPSDVEIVSMASPEAANALLQGQVDAAVLPDPSLTKAVASKKAVLLRNAEGLILGQAVIAARTEFVQQYPDIAKKFLEVHQRVLEWAQANEDEALSLTAAKIQMEIPAVKALYPKFDFSMGIDQNNIDQLKNSADFLKDNNFLKAGTDTQSVINGLVDTAYLPAK